MKKSYRLLFSLLAGLLITPVQAANTEQSAPPWYAIEFILFSNDDPAAGSSERWPELPQATQPEPAPTAPVEITPLPETEWKLTSEAAALQRSGHFTPLIHQAWQQQVLDRKHAPAIPLRSMQEVAPGIPRLQGTIKISVNRYLHIDLDLVLRRRTERYEAFPDGIESYRFRAHRRMRSGELHYIDHPMSGMLIELTPVERMPENEPEKPAVEEPVVEEATATPVAEEQQKTAPNTGK